ncbi:hypothetical protein WJX72_003634 [[Myrmecia] bisecta]|uniref:Uncharacterized protein n=1 Tax=[Myrmecia] bisecta TaxID=41462 RepID=A0AAW1R5X8_9CHLO
MGRGLLFLLLICATEAVPVWVPRGGGDLALVAYSFQDSASYVGSFDLTTPYNLTVRGASSRGTRGTSQSDGWTGASCISYNVTSSSDVNAAIFDLAASIDSSYSPEQPPVIASSVCNQARCSGTAKLDPQGLYAWNATNYQDRVDRNWFSVSFTLHAGNSTVCLQATGDDAPSPYSSKQVSPEAPSSTVPAAFAARVFSGRPRVAHHCLQTSAQTLLKLRSCKAQIRILLVPQTAGHAQLLAHLHPHPEPPLALAHKG